MYLLTVRTGPSSSIPLRGKDGRCICIDGVPRGHGMVLADNGKVMEDKKKKDFNIETMMDEFLAVETMNTILMGLAMLMCVVVIY